MSGSDNFGRFAVLSSAVGCRWREVWSAARAGRRRGVCRKCDRVLAAGAAAATVAAAWRWYVCAGALGLRPCLVAEARGSAAAGISGSLRGG
jgi:hypothetical protein